MSFIYERQCKRTKREWAQRKIKESYVSHIVTWNVGRSHILRSGNVRPQSPRKATQIAQGDVPVQKTFLKRFWPSFYNGQSVFLIPIPVPHSKSSVVPGYNGLTKKLAKQPIVDITINNLRYTIIYSPANCHVITPHYQLQHQDNVLLECQQSCSRFLHQSFYMGFVVVKESLNLLETVDIIEIAYVQLLLQENHSSLVFGLQ